MVHHDMKNNIRVILFFLFCFLTLPLFAAKPNLLAPDQAFQFQISMPASDRIHLHWTMAPDYYLYQDKIHIQPDLPIIEWRFPNTAIFHDHRWIYPNSLDIPLKTTADVQTLKLNIEYQGCYQKTVCYLPIKKQFRLELREKKITPTSDLSFASEKFLSENTQDQITTTPIKPEKNQNAQPLYLKKPFYISFIIFLILGMLIGLTPCVMPLIPILMSILAAGKNRSKSSDFLIALFYVFGMALTYALTGLIAAWTGKSIQVFLQTPLILVLSSSLLIYMAWVLWKGKSWQTPELFQKILRRFILDTGFSNAFGAFIAGASAMLILSPCVTAPLIGILAYITQSKDLGFGFLSLFILGLGQGIPLLLFCLLAKKIWQRIGFLSAYVKYILIFILLALSLQLLFRLPIAQSLLEKIEISNPIAQRITVKTQVELNDALKTAKTQKEWVILDFYAGWCESCKIMEKTIFQNKNILNQLKSFTVIKVDLSENSFETQKLMSQFEVIAPPTMIFISNLGLEIPNARLVGEVSSTEFSKQLDVIYKQR